MKPTPVWLRGTLFVAAALSFERSVQAQTQCGQWLGGLGPQGPDQAVHAHAVYDDGTGPLLYVGGRFETVGDVLSHGLAKWDGQQWFAFGGDITCTINVDPAIRSMAVFDDGTGDKLYVGGRFDTIGGVNAKNIAMWDGTSWSPLSTGSAGEVQTLRVFDDGSGDKLYVGALFNAPMGGFNTGLARWDGANWSLAGAALTGGVFALREHDDGGGPQLYAGGTFASIGGAPFANLARWNGSSWSDVSGGVPAGNGSRVYALESFDDGSGPALYVGGSFASVGAGLSASNVAMWRGGTWSALGAGTFDAVTALRAFDDGSGDALYVGGRFFILGSGLWCHGIARWTAGVWSVVGSPEGIAFTASSPWWGSVDLFEHDDGSGQGPALFVAGNFQLAGGMRADNIARWNGIGWSALGTQNGLDDQVLALGSFDDGSGNGVELYAGGKFNQGGATATGPIAKWNGSAWTNITSTSDSIYSVDAFQVYDDGTSPKLYAAGRFVTLAGANASGVASWDGTQWSNLGSGFASGVAGVEVHALAVYDGGAGEQLCAAGLFDQVGGISASNIAFWNGSTWSVPPVGPDREVHALAVLDDGQGGGPQLYAGGSFSRVGTTVVRGIARWNGSTWSKVGIGFNGYVSALAALDDGTGTKLFAAGPFTTADGVPCPWIAEWNGVTWSPLAAAAPSNIRRLGVYDDGSGPALLAGFGSSSPFGKLGKWDGQFWSKAFGGVDDAVWAIHAFDRGPSQPLRLAIGGDFHVTGTVGSGRVGIFERGCPCAPHVYCTAGTSSNGCVPSISAVGAPSASGIGSCVVSAQSVEGSKSGLIFYGVTGAGLAGWGSSSSHLCVAPPVQRTTISSSGGTSGACDGALALDFNAYLATHPSALGQPFYAGALVWMQAWYRDPGSAKTTALTDALELLMCP